jgi:hypothetical protein
MIDFGRGSAVIIDGAEVVSSKNDLWYPNDNSAGAIDFTVRINGPKKIEIYGSEGCCDGTARLW